MTDTPALDLATVNAACDAATPGPWTVGEKTFDRGNRWRLPVEYQCRHDEDDVRPDQLCVVEYPEDGFQFPRADAAFIAGARAWVPDLVAEVERLQTIVDKVTALCAGTAFHASCGCCTTDEPPDNGTLVIAHYTGGHQNIDVERAYVRSDRAESEGDPNPGGDWYGVGAVPAHPQAWGEVLWLDDPACDRGSVSIEAYVPADELARILADGAA